MSNRTKERIVQDVVGCGSFFKFFGTYSHTSLTRQHLEVTSFKPRANGRNIVGQQLPTFLDVTCCVRFHTQFIVGSCCVRLHAALGLCESLTGIKETLTLSSPCATFSKVLSLNSFAWTTWPQTL